MFNPDQLDPYVDYNLSCGIARMYFGDESYLNESLTRYVNIRYIEGKYGYRHSISGNSSGLLSISTPYSDLREEVYSGFRLLKGSNLKLSALTLPDEPYQDNTAIYYRGTMAMRQISIEMGIDLFDRAICSYYENLRNSTVGSLELLEALEKFSPGFTGKAEAILYSEFYPDFSFKKILNSENSVILHIQEKNNTGYSSIVNVNTDMEAEVFTVKDGDIITVHGKLLSASIDPEWKTLDINRKNNNFPRKFNFFISKNSEYEAGSFGLAFGVVEEAGKKENNEGVMELDFMAGVQYESPGLNSFYIEGGVLINSIIPVPYQSLNMPQFLLSGLFSGAAFESSQNRKIGVGFRYYLDGRWQAALSLMREEKYTEHSLYYPQIYYTLGLGVNEQIEISASIELLYTNLSFLIPFLMPAVVNTSLDTFTLNYCGTASLSFFSYLRLFPRIYLSPSIESAVGFGTEDIPDVPGRAREAKEYTGKYRVSAGIDLLFPIVNNLDAKILNILLLRSILSSIYFEIEQLDFLSDQGLQSMHMGLEIGFRFSTINSVLTGDTISPVAIGIDIPIYDITNFQEYKIFLYTSLPLKYYGMILSY